MGYKEDHCENEQQMNCSAGYVKRGPRKQPYSQQNEEQHQKNKVAYYPHIFPPERV